MTRPEPEAESIPTRPDERPESDMGELSAALDPPAGRAGHRAPEDVAALLRERIYGDIACLSTLLVLTGALHEVEGAWSAVLDVVVATGGLFAASALAEFVAHLGLHGHPPKGRELVLLFRTSGQILEAAVVPVLLLVLAGIGVLSLHTALWAGVWVLIVVMGLFALLAARRTELRWWGQLLLVAVLIGLGVLVVVVKTLAH